MSEPIFRIGRVVPPSTDEEWDDPTLDKDKLREMWAVEIDMDARLGSCWGHEGMIEIHGDTKEQVLFFAEAIISKLNDPKLLFLLNLKQGLSPIPRVRKCTPQLTKANESESS